MVSETDFGLALLVLAVNGSVWVLVAFWLGFRQGSKR